MDEFSSPVMNLIGELSRLPGIGRKSAQRLALHMIRMPKEQTRALADAIIEEYELFDGWYWTTPCDVRQDFHGHPESPGWNTTIAEKKLKAFLPGWYGCRWPIDHVRKTSPDRGGYAECFAFAQFIGYLL